MNYKSGFTLAEVLITLGIIGVVAALTIPTLVNEYRKKVFVTKVKYTYSLMSNVIQRSVAENGDIKYWDFGADYSAEGVEFVVQKYFEPYLQVNKHGISGVGGYYTQLKNGITILWRLDGQSNQGKPPSAIYALASLNANKTSMTDSSRDYSHEDFILVIKPSLNSLSFFNWVGSSREDMKQHSPYGCNKDIVPNLRFHCGVLLQHDNWEIKEDYPW